VSPLSKPLGIDLTIIVDVANVMGARPDGWWKDRAAAAADDNGSLVLAEPAQGEVSAEGGYGSRQVPADAVPLVRLVLAPGSGDDTLAELAADLGGRRIVVTADRELRRRCEQAGAVVTGPRWLLELLKHVI
jgi:8-oxo-dGTP diphosphatase